MPYKFSTGDIVKVLYPPPSNSYQRTLQDYERSGWEFGKTTGEIIEAYRDDAFRDWRQNVPDTTPQVETRNSYYVLAQHEGGSIYVEVPENYLVAPWPSEEEVLSEYSID